MTITRLRDAPINTEGNFVVRHLLPAADLTVVWGPPKCGKTFWVIDLAMHIAAGIKYRGRAVRQGDVVYCSLEGNHEFNARAHASKTQLKLDDPPFFLSKDKRVFSKVGGADGLIVDIQSTGVTPILIVIDTLNKSLDGSENSDEDMTHYTRCAESLYRAFNCSVIVVHHCGIAGNKPRGHTSLTGTCAAQIKVARSSEGPSNPMLISSTIEFMKDGPEGDQMFSWLRSVVVGQDRDNMPIETCYIEDAPKPADKAGTMRTPQTKKAKSILEELIKASDEGNRVTLTEWKTACRNMGLSRTKMGFGKAFDRAFDALIDAKEITIIRTWIYLGDITEEPAP